MAVQTAELPRLHRRYIDEIVPSLVAEFRYLNAMQVPWVEKVVINIGSVRRSPMREPSTRPSST